MSSRVPFIAGNWKMHGSLSMIAALMNDLCQMSKPPRVDIALCPPNIYIPEVGQLLKKKNSQMWLGAQNVYHEPEGAFTGEISVQMLKDIGCRCVIVGHSERRQLFSESDGLVADKVQAAIANGLVPIVCLGETEQEREQGSTEGIVERQLLAVLERITKDDINKLILAYEPIWAIGTGLTASPRQAQAVHRFLRGTIAAKDQAASEQLRILYGGSVKPNNAQELFSQPDIDGGLIGGASLKAEDFIAICQAAT